MASRPNRLATRRRASSGASTHNGPEQKTKTADRRNLHSFAVHATLWTHDDAFSTEDVLINEAILEGSGIVEGQLVEVLALKDGSDSRDFQSPAGKNDSSPAFHRASLESQSNLDQRSRILCTVTFATGDIKTKQTSLQISVRASIAARFGLKSRSQILIQPADKNDWAASHVELAFRDVYLARSDMWRMVCQELIGKTVYIGQKISFLSTIRTVVKSIHVQGRLCTTAFFSEDTVPVFRSEAARYVLFIQMSKEMWNFDSEGNGEIMFNRVINGFLPDLFKRWTELEVRHLVSIIMFGRLEFDRFGSKEPLPNRDLPLSSNLPQQQSLLHGDQSPSSKPNRTGSYMNSNQTGHYEDFYRVVVTDMASAQWTTILDELKKDFRVFLRDITLHSSSMNGVPGSRSVPKIEGRPSSALKGNILEAINIASSQFSNDYVDRDLIRTGISVVVITASPGVFEVDRELLRLTSETLTNNGIGIDIVSLSRMPLHSVPLFKYRAEGGQPTPHKRDSRSLAASPQAPSKPSEHLRSVQGNSPIFGSFASTSMQRTSRMDSSGIFDNSSMWHYGIPHWIDLSYWSSANPRRRTRMRISKGGRDRKQFRGFESRVRMYEVQMMGLMELGMADIMLPYLKSSQESKRWRRKWTKAHPNTGKRGDLSTSPKARRKDQLSASQLRPNQSLLPSNAKSLGAIYDFMDEYDEDTFRIKRKVRTKTSTRETIGDDQHLLKKEISASKPLEVQPKSPKHASPKTNAQQQSSIKTLPTISKLNEKPHISRSISYAFRGLAPPLRAAPSTEVNVENVQAQSLLSQPLFTQSKAVPRPTSSASSNLFFKDVSKTNSGRDADSASLVDSPSTITSKLTDEIPSKPISIYIPKQNAKPTQKGDPPKSNSNINKQMSERSRKQDASVSSVSTTSDDSSDESYDNDPREAAGAVVPPDGEELPFVRQVNASNPLRGPAKSSHFFGRWQHLYPRKPRAATVKWRSLCTPAAVPLTTEEIPPVKSLENDYHHTCYRVKIESAIGSSESTSTTCNLLKEMISLRLAHGYQVVVGSKVSVEYELEYWSKGPIYNLETLSQSGQTLFLSMGNTLQKLTMTTDSHIQVDRYVRKRQNEGPAWLPPLRYCPNIRTILSNVYKMKPMDLEGFSEEYPWEKADGYLANSKRQPSHEVQSLRFWRARFVLLPVEPPANTARLVQSVTDENEEEIHLLGIRALTQMWQKARYIPQDERRPARGRVNLAKKDPNPLRINFQTLNPSEVVATELDKLVTSEENGEHDGVQLLRESELLDRESATRLKVAQAMQGEHGVEIKTRRWHFKLHLGCFEGEEFTNWLISNFRDIDTRAEAVEFGNELLKEGLFEHVNGRRKFKDGNYFYSISPDWRLPRHDLKQSWFTGNRRNDRSVPPTPSSDTPAVKEFPLSGRSRSGSGLANQATMHMLSELSKSMTERKKVSVSLSNMLRIDVDPRTRSDRPEIVNLHYDRIHNPENCYHLELSWLNVTSKLVDDAIVSWTTQAEKYGLKLVEVPIAEAAEVPNNEPFRAVYTIKLRISPPAPASMNNVTATLTTSAFVPQNALLPDRHFYQKALLKKFNFVLDLEGASEFPENVDIQYSWGRLEYKYTQFVHRSGVILAQITHEGDFLLLANRLYNSRLASAKDTQRLDNRRENTFHPTANNAKPAMLSLQASGIIGLNMPSPSPVASPQVRPATGTMSIAADVLGSRGALQKSGLAQYVTPEQIKDDLEAFCSDAEKLKAFYTETTTSTIEALPSGMASGHGGSCRRTAGSGSTSSSVLAPIREPDPSIPPMSLGESAAASGAGRVGVRSFRGGSEVVAAPAAGPITEQRGEQGRSGGPAGSSTLSTPMVLPTTPKRRNTTYSG